MTYQHTLPAIGRTQKAWHRADSAILSVAIMLGLAAILVTALVTSDMPEIQPIPGNDWHGNAAASDHGM